MKQISQSLYRWLPVDKVDQTISSVDHVVTTLENGKKIVYCKIDKFSGSGRNPETGNFTESKWGCKVTPIFYDEFDNLD